MELTANRRPFLYFPLANHFEQQRHVACRLDRYRVGRRLQYAEVGPEDLAEALVAELARPLDYRPSPPTELCEPRPCWPSSSSPTTHTEGERS